MDEATHDEAAVIGLFLQRCLEDRERGGLRSLADYQAEFPGYERAIEREFRQLEAGVPGAELDPEHAAGGDRAADPVRRYRVLDEIAHGGFGSILRVWERDLRRPLAMKVLREPRSEESRDGGPSFSQLLGRFVEEAQITAQLDHPGIVPVHELGLDSAGRMYFTMSLVRGQTFEQIIELVQRGAEGWTLSRAVDVLLRVCEAVAFAHSKGVVHRDLKPANVMVGRFGETRVMDWGLARVLDGDDHRDLRPVVERAGDDPDVGASVVLSARRDSVEELPGSPLRTLEGDVIGTPAYMPPEQAAGRVEEVGPLADVYAIGAMLYHLLVGVPPYVEKGSRTSSRVILDRVRAGPPPALGELVDGAPAELVAICELAMARRPQDRYAGVLALADDLRNYRETRVVHAHEAGAFAELRKWVRRNRALAAASVAAVLALAIGLGFSLAENRRARKSAEVAEVEARRAETNFEMALQAVDEMLAEVGDRTLADVPQMDAVRRSLLQKALAFHQRLLAARRDDPRARLELARSHDRIGSLHGELGDLAAAIAARQRAVDILGELRAEDPADAELLAVELDARIAVAAYLANRGEQEESQRRFEEVVPLLEELVRRRPDDAEHRASMANLLRNVALGRQRGGDAAGGLELARQAIEVAEETVERWPDNPSHTANLAFLYKAYAHLLLEAGRREDCIAAAERGLELSSAVLEQRPDSREIRYDHARLLNLLAIVQRQLQRNRDAIGTFENAAQMLRQLVEEFPDTAGYHGELGGVLCNRGNALRAERDWSGALASYEAAVAAGRRAFELAPQSAIHRDYLGRQCRSLCKLLLGLRRHRETVAFCEEIATLDYGNFEPRLWAAAYTAASIALLAADAELTDDERAALRSRYGDRAMDYLLQARSEGMRDPKLLQNGRLDPIRDRADFQALVGNR